MRITSGSRVKFTSKIGLLSHLPGMHYLEVPRRVVKELGGLKIRLVCCVNRKVTFQCGMMALGQGRAYISITKNRLKELNLGIGNKVDVELRIDRSKYGMEMPDELKAVLEQDGEGDRRFHSLTPGKQRYVIQYVGAVRNEEKRIERGIMLIENLKKLPMGKESFREILGLPSNKRKPE